MKQKSLTAIITIVACALLASAALLVSEVIRQDAEIRELKEEEIILRDASGNMAYYIEMLQAELEAERKK